MSNTITFHDAVSADPFTVRAEHTMRVIERWGRNLPEALDLADGHRDVEMTAGDLADAMVSKAREDKLRIEAAPHSLKGHKRAWYVLDEGAGVYWPTIYTVEE